MKPDPHKQQLKKIRAAAHELKVLQKRLRHPPSVPLDEPIQRGWIRRYVLTKAAELRPDREMLEWILLDIGTERLSWRRDFLEKRHRGSRRLVQINQALKDILIDHWSTDRQTRPEEWKRYFHLEYLPYCGGLQWFYVFTQAHLFELKVEPHWLTHVYKIEPHAISRQAELEAWMTHHLGWQKYERSKGRSRWWRRLPLRDKLDRHSKLELRRFRIAPEEADTKPQTVRFRISLFLFPHVAQCRGTPLRTEPVRVQILPWGVRRTAVLVKGA